MERNVPDALEEHMKGFSRTIPQHVQEVKTIQTTEENKVEKAPPVEKITGKNSAESSIGAGKRWIPMGRKHKKGGK
jgi:hypothetical protein